MAGVDKSTGKASSDPGWVFPRWWEETAETIAYDSSSWSPPITLVCGPGNSGKSTFSRLLLNTLLPRSDRFFPLSFCYRSYWFSVLSFPLERDGVWVLLGLSLLAALFLIRVILKFRVFVKNYVEMDACRYRRVGYLDTDVGQPEFTTPGCVSLHIIDKQTPGMFRFTYVLCFLPLSRYFV